MQHTVVILSKDEDGNVTPFVRICDDKRELNSFLKECEIRRHSSAAMAGKCFVEDKTGDSMIIFKGVPMAIEFKESFSVPR
jgi:hypothetical protein